MLLKFLEAHLAGRASERDALLPALAAVTAATPEEFAALGRVLKATKPAAVQMLSVFGLAS